MKKNKTFIIMNRDGNKKLAEIDTALVLVIVKIVISGDDIFLIKYQNGTQELIDTGKDTRIIDVFDGATVVYIYGLEDYCEK